MSGAAHSTTKRPGWVTALALLALAIQVLVPSGFMVSAADAAPTVVICTGHGPLLIGADPANHPTKAPKPKPAAACAFAGHGTATGSPLQAPSVAIAFSSAVEVADLKADLMPGRGMAAPPPPSRGPPASRI
jgi:hypothetical protein